MGREKGRARFVIQDAGEGLEGMESGKHRVN